MVLVPYTDPLNEAKEMYSEFRQCLSKVLAGQSYSIAGRSYQRANLKEVSDNITYWGDRIQELQNRAARGGIRIRGGVPLS